MKHSLLPFEDFLTYLQQQGFDLGVDDFLQIQAMLNLLPDDCSPEKLKRFLAPLVVSNEEEQAFFYLAFDRYFADIILKHRALKIPDAPTKQAKSKAMAEEMSEEQDWKYEKYEETLEFRFKDFVRKQMLPIAGVLVVVILLIANVFVFTSNQKQSKTPSNSDIELRMKGVPEELHEQVKESHEELKTLIREEIANKKSTKSVKPSKDHTSNPRGWEMSDSGVSTPEPKAKQKTWEAESNFTKEVSHVRKSMQEVAASPDFGFWLFVALVSGLYVFWIVRWYFKTKREFQLQALEHIHPPQYWNIRVPKSELSLTRSKHFKNAATQLQTRQTIPTSRIDVHKTIAATIESAGFPTFEFLKRSELPEYLLLIDQSSTNDQQAKWFEMWFEGLKAQEVLVHCYFFHQNTNQFWDAKERFISLKELQQRFGECRLVVISDLKAYLDQEGKPISKGEIVALGEDLNDWEDRIWMTNSVLSKSIVELLEEESGFTILPARLESLNQVASLFDSEKPVSSNVEALPLLESVDWRSLNARETVLELRRVLNPTSYRWLCATAVYPELNWDLTIFIGETLFDEKVLMREENVLPLVSLPWFRRGEMPEVLRRLLLEELREQDKKMVKEAILHLLQLHPLVEDEATPEFFDYQLYIALERARIHAHDRQKLKALHELSKEAQFKKSKYKEVVLRYLDEQKNTLGLGNSFEDFYEQKDNAKAYGQKKFFYPKANFENRFGSMVVKTLRIFMVNLFVLIFVLLVLDKLGIPENLSFVIGVVISLIGSLRTADGEVGGWHDESSEWMLLVNVRTNQVAGFWKTALRRCVDLIPLAAFAAWEFYAGMSLFYFGVAVVVLAVVNLVLIDVGRGRRLGDWILGTQVVNRYDYEKGEWERKQIEKESGLGSQASS